MIAGRISQEDPLVIVSVDCRLKSTGVVAVLQQANYSATIAYAISVTIENHETHSQDWCSLCLSVL